MRLYKGESAEKVKNFTLIGFFTAVLIFCTLMLFVINGKNAIYSVDPDAGDTMQLSSGWEYHYGDESGIVKMPVSFRYKEGESYYVTKTLDADMERIHAPSLLVAAKYCNLDVYLDQECICRYRVPENGFSSTAGTVFLIVELPDKWYGKELTLKYDPLLEDSVSYQVKVPVMGGEAGMVIKLLTDQMSAGILGCILIFMGVMLIAVYFASRRKVKLDRNFFCLGIFSITCAVYIMCQMDYLHLIIKNPYTIYALEYFSLNMLPIPLYLIIRNNTDKKYTILLNIATGLACVNFVFQYAANFFFGFDFKRMLLMSHCIIIIGVIFIAVALFRTTGEKRRKKREVLISILPLAAGGIVDIFLFYNKAGGNITFWFKMGIIIFILFQLYFNYKEYMSIYEERLEADLFKKLAFTDYMTHLGNRTAYEKTLDRLEDHIQDIMNIWYFSVDINNLKRLNDTEGHLEGDRLIAGTAAVLKNAAGTEGEVYRIGGDEFVIIFVDKDESYINKFLDKLYEEQIRYSGENGPEIDFSLGYSSFNREYSNSIKEMILEADRNMYQNKKQSKKARKE